MKRILAYDVQDVVCVILFHSIRLCIQSTTSDCLQCHLHHAWVKHPGLFENVFIVHDSDTTHAADTVSEVWWHWG